MTDLDYITRQEVLEAFRGLLPGVTVIEIDHEDYIEESMQHPFIQSQIQAGIYSVENIGEEFLSVARTFVNERVIEIDTWLIEQHMKGVDLVAAFGYVASVALHEYHHVVHHGGPPVSHAEQMAREIECSDYLNKHHAEVMKAAADAESQSKTIQRVYSRMAALASRP